MTISHCLCALIASLGIVMVAGMSLNKNGESVTHIDIPILPELYSVNDIEDSRRNLDETDRRIFLNKIDYPKEDSEEVKLHNIKWTRNSDLPTIYHPRIG